MFKTSSLGFKERTYFGLVLPIALVIESAFTSTLDWQANPRAEWVTLFDLCIFLPLLYLTFFSHQISLKARLIRTAGIAGLGFFAARFMVPEANQFVITDLAQVRNAMLAFLILFECWVFYKVVQAVYKHNADAQTLERNFAMPAWVAKLMILEARFWKAVWSFFKRK